MRKRDAKGTKELILNTAITEFAKYGYDGVRMEKIAKEAKVSKAVIYYHFKDKKFVFETVLLNFVEFVIKHVLISQEYKVESEEKIKAFLDAMIYVVLTHREMSKILMQELFLEGKNINQSVKKEVYKVLSVLVDTVEEGIKKEVFKKVDPLLIYSTIVGTTNYYYNAKKAMNEEDIDLKSSINEVKNMILSYILKR